MKATSQARQRRPPSRNPRSTTTSPNVCVRPLPTGSRKSPLAGPFRGRKSVQSGSFILVEHTIRALNTEMIPFEHKESRRKRPPWPSAEHLTVDAPPIHLLVLLKHDRGVGPDAPYATAPRCNVGRPEAPMRRDLVHEACMSCADDSEKSPPTNRFCAPVVRVVTSRKSRTLERVVQQSVDTAPEPVVDAC